MMVLSAGTRIWIVAGVTDMRCGFQGLAAKVIKENKHQKTARDAPGTVSRIFWRWWRDRTADGFKGKGEGDDLV